MGYTSDTLKGFSWMSAFRIVSRVFAFFRIAILARLLSPFQFGLFGVASLVLAFFETFTQTGTSIFLIQQKEKFEAYLNTAFVLSIIRGLVIGLLIYFMAPYLSYYFHSPESLEPLKLISLVAVIRGFINPARVKFVKNLQFNYEFTFSFTVFLIDAATSVVLAFVLRSPISMVWGLMAGAVFEAILSHVFILPRPKIILNFKQLKIMLSKGKWITGSSIFGYLFEQGDDLFVGRLLGPSALGIYQAAYKIATLPITEVVKVANQVTFPIYTNISGEKWRLKRAFIRTSLGTLVFIIPIGLLLYLFPMEITILLLGEKWIAAAPIIKLLSIFGVLRAFVVSVNPLFNSIKRQDVIAKIAFIGTMVMLLTMMPMIEKWGIVGTAYSVLLGSLSTLPFIYYYFRKVLI